ncbi:hypothetical protein [Rathayibacter tritici]|uniref:hypothetical protein n=1 Tax=Rathayibacter tritici TaxID=33888 RepID=UPI0011B05110|nr:hypothetical protein [Rathayibacter tritici]
MGRSGWNIHSGNDLSLSCIQGRSFLNIGTTPWFQAYRKLSDLVYNYVFWLCGVSLVERIAILETTLFAAHEDGWRLASLIDDKSAPPA